MTAKPQETSIGLDELLDSPVAYGFVKIHCDKCGSDNYYDAEFAKTVTQCFGCSVKKDGRQ